MLRSLVGSEMCIRDRYTAVPTIHQTLLLRAAEDYPKHDPPKLRFIRSCSSSLAAATMHKVQDAFGAKVLEAYAMSEACHQMTSNPLPKHGPNKPGTVGRATNMQLAIMDTDNNQLPVGEVGEVCIRGQNVTMGYRGDRGSKANLEAFAAGWFHTGDQGFLDPDGYLTLTGRLKELINRGGEKISPLEVDALLLGHPHVTEACSFAAPDEKYGEEVAAVVVVKTKCTAEDIQKFCADKVSIDKVPKRIFFADAIPKNATGKIQRRIVAQHFLQPKAKL
eukprot:TRINITY_DN19364_c0_g1_i3.p1 TRINITY_DN19364_c0_g1~~TRINITY_DN19364_c0_g1_i3.p1  ORF type:complete len:278 (+),score=95.69 TRINITY_DN19364_c0_g1_i3:116-949(+)